MFCNHLPRRPAAPKVKKAKVYHPNIQAIFKKLYRVRMFSRDTISIDEQRQRGVAVTGNRGIDKAMSTSYSFPYITIADMVDYFSEGIPIYLTKETDSKEIYEAVCDHTGAWRVVLGDAFNLGEAPLEDLINMENFVSSIYEKAKFEYLKRPDRAVIAGTLSDFLYNGSNLKGISFNANDELSVSGKTLTRRNLKDEHHAPNISVFRDTLMKSVTGGSSVRNH